MLNKLRTTAFVWGTTLQRLEELLKTKAEMTL
jgi:hypothetical protein